MDIGFGKGGVHDGSRQTSTPQAAAEPAPLAGSVASGAASAVSGVARTPQARPGASSAALNTPSKIHGVQPSPLKRRGSDGPAQAVGGTAIAGIPTSSGAGVTGTAEGTASAAKRARPEAKAPKVLPERYELCDVEDMVVLIASMIGELIETNDPRALQSGNLTRFHSRTAPGISVVDYLFRLAKHATLTPPLLLSMVYYIDRLCAMYPDFTINTLTVHRFLITAATVAAKGLSDSFWNNSTYARVGGIRVAELKMLELEFLYRLDWRIVPNPEVLEAYYRPLVDRCPGYVLEGWEGDSSIDDGEDEEESEDLEDDGDSPIANNCKMPVDIGSNPAEADSSSGRGQPNDAPNPLGGGTQGSHLSPPVKGHCKQSSTNLIGEDMVASGGLTGPPGL